MLKIKSERAEEQTKRDKVISLVITIISAAAILLVVGVPSYQMAKGFVTYVDQQSTPSPNDTRLNK